MKTYVRNFLTPKTGARLGRQGFRQDRPAFPVSETLS